MEESPTPPQISVLTGIWVGLAASFVQSLGLTIQRKSHLHNESLPVGLRLRDHRRPLWCFGFGIFLCSNLLGTIFQVGALPLVVLGPLGAVSLLYNAFFAKIILGDQFSIQLVAGTILIAGGAVLIGIFGVVPEQTTHTLDELVAYYTRTAFLIWISLLSVALLAILTLAHITEWAIDRKLNNSPLTPRTPNRKRFRRWSQGPRPPPPQPSFSPSVPGHTHAPGNEGRYGTFEAQATRPSKPKAVLRVESAAEAKGTIEASDEAIERRRTIVGVAYGGASGTLSGLCLLFAKTGIELLILTAVGQNQLFYLNRALRLVGPTLICPLAFCFYNLSSIISGLVYYDQMDQLSWLQIGLVTFGTGVLLGGVWLVSIKKDQDEDEAVALRSAGESCNRFADEPEPVTADEAVDDESDDEEPVQWIPRGLSIGIGAASPGFDLRPARRRATLHILPNSPPPTSPTTERSSMLPQHTHSAAPDERGGHLRRLARDRGRTKSLSGGVYVGRTSFEGEQQIAVHGLGLPYDVRAAGEGDVFAEPARGEWEAGGGRATRKGAGWSALKAKFAEAFSGSREARD